MRMAERPQEIITVTRHHVNPEASSDVTLKALGPVGGGPVAGQVDPRTGDTHAVQKYFSVELTAPNSHGVITAGGRVYVRFVHDSEPLAYRWGRGLRRLFLTTFQI